jgi:hypothetical protein
MKKNINLYSFTLNFLLLFCALNLVAQEHSCSTSCCGEPHNTLQMRGILAITLNRLKFTPSVLQYNAAGNFKMEASITGTASRVTLNVGGVFNDFNDSGINGDLVAGDNIYTLQYPIASVVSSLRTADAYRPLLGYLEFYEIDMNTSQVVKTSQYNVFVQIRTANMPNVTINTFGGSTTEQATDHIYNTIGTNSDATQIATVSNRFYTHFTDLFDFHNYIMVPGFRGNRYHFAVKNAITGIGLSSLNNSSTYGTGLTNLKGISVFPIPAFYDPQAQGYVHELGHQWINFTTGTPLASGIPHFPMSNIATSVMGFSIGGPGGAGGNFNKTFTPQSGGYNLSDLIESSFPVFNQWELYLMGLIPKTDVTTDALIFNDQTTFPANGFYPNSAFSTYNINSLVTTLGERVPNSATSQKQYRAATLIISDALLSASEMAYYDFMTRRADMTTSVPATDGFLQKGGTPFYLATGARATLSTCLTTCATLPIELLDFTAKSKDTKALLTWQTASETNVKDFEIQKSTDGKAFSTFTFKKANNTPSVYQAFDDDFTTAAYYRLKINDLDATYAFSKTLFLEKNPNEKIKINRNTGGVVEVETEDKIETILVSNLIGQVMKTTKEVQFSLSNLPSGFYLIYVKTNNSYKSEKFFKP